MNPHPCSCNAQGRVASFHLSDAANGSLVRICCMESRGRLARRLAEMGFVPGTEIKVLRRAPLSDPIEFQLRGYLISLRREEARLIRVKPVSFELDKVTLSAHPATALPTPEPVIVPDPR